MTYTAQSPPIHVTKKSDELGEAVQSKQMEGLKGVIKSGLISPDAANRDSARLRDNNLSTQFDANTIINNNKASEVENTNEHNRESNLQNMKSDSVQSPIVSSFKTNGGVRSQAS